MDYFVLNLDLTKPQIFLNIQNDYENNNLKIIIQGNEELLEGLQNIYLKKNGIKLDVDFNYENDSKSFVGILPKDLIKNSSTQVYAKVKDLAGNDSNIIDKNLDFVCREDLFLANIIGSEQIYTVNIYSIYGRGDYLNHDYCKI